MYGIAYAPSTSSFAAGQTSVFFNKPSPTRGHSVLPIKNVFRQRGPIDFIREKTPKAVSSQVVNPLIVCKSQFPCPNKEKFSFSGASKPSNPPLKSLKPPGAYNEFYKFKYPVLKVKPEWWWRTLACVPYLIGLQISYTGYLFQPFVQKYDFFADIIFFVPGAITRLPIWFVMVYSYCVYIGIVKNKDWPHYFRFHVVMGMLLELLLQIVWTASNFFPLIHYDGMLGLYYWAFVGVAHIVLTLMCVSSALMGSYCNIPIISDAAYIHTLFHIGGFQRPF